jgi:hypothetical protein
VPPGALSAHGACALITGSRQSNMYGKRRPLGGTRVNRISQIVNHAEVRTWCAPCVPFFCAPQKAILENDASDLLIIRSILFSGN